MVTVSDLADAIDREDGLHVTLTATYPTEGRDRSVPGRVTLTGAQTKAFLAGTTDDAGTRWEIVLTALLSDPPRAGADRSTRPTTRPRRRGVQRRAKGADIADVPTDR